MIEPTNKTATQYLDRFLKSKGISLDKSLYDRILYLISGCGEGLYKYQNIHKNILLPIITRKLDGDLRQWYIAYRNLGPGRATKVKMVYLYGEEEGCRRWDVYCSTQADTNTFEYKNKKYGMSREEFSRYNSSRAVTLENLTIRHGDTIGKKKFSDYCDRQAYAGCSLEYFVDLYGNEAGKLKYAEVNETKRLTIDNMKRIYGEKEGEEKYHTWRENNMKAAASKIGFSPISQELFVEVDKRLSFCVDSMYGAKEREFGIYDRETRKSYLYDYTVRNLKLIIEFNGDLYHANPKKYSPDHVFSGYPFYGKTAKDLWEHDKIKIAKANSYGYEVITVWECDYRQNKEYIIKKCVEYINELYARKM